MIGLKLSPLDLDRRLFNFGLELDREYSEYKVG